MSNKVFNGKSRAELVELALQSCASVAGKSRGICQENQSASQEGVSKVSSARKLSIMLNYVLDLSNFMLYLSDYVLDLSDYAGTSNVSSNPCIA